MTSKIKINTNNKSKTPKFDYQKAFEESQLDKTPISKPVTPKDPVDSKFDL